MHLPAIIEKIPLQGSKALHPLIKVLSWPYAGRSTASFSEKTQPFLAVVAQLSSWKLGQRKRSPHNHQGQILNLWKLWLHNYEDRYPAGVSCHHTIIRPDTQLVQAVVTQLSSWILRLWKLRLHNCEAEYSASTSSRHTIIQLDTWPVEPAAPRLSIRM